MFLCSQIFSAVIVFLLGLTAPSANAFRVTPMIVDVEPSGQKAIKTLRVINSKNKPLPFEVVIEKRIINEDGSEQRSPAEDDFLIFPPQGIIAPAKSQALRLQYIGAPKLASSQGYVITIQQAPVKLKKERQSGIQFHFRFGVSVNVVPKGYKPDIQVIEHKRTGKKLDLLVKNVGNAYTRLTTGQWLLSDSNKDQHTLPEDPVREAIEQPLIQPGKTRRIHLPLPKTFQGTAKNILYKPL